MLMADVVSTPALWQTPDDQDRTHSHQHTGSGGKVARPHQIMPGMCRKQLGRLVLSRGYVEGQTLNNRADCEGFVRIGISRHRALAVSQIEHVEETATHDALTALIQPYCNQFRNQCKTNVNRTARVLL